MDIVNGETVPLPTDSEAIAMKMHAASNCLKSRTPKAVQDFDDAMKILGKLYHEDGYIAYKDEIEKAAVRVAFNWFYPRYKEAKEAGEKEGKVFWTEEQWKVSSKSTRFVLSSRLFVLITYDLLHIFRENADSRISGCS